MEKLVFEISNGVFENEYVNLTYLEKTNQIQIVANKEQVYVTFFEEEGKCISSYGLEKGSNLFKHPVVNKIVVSHYADKVLEIEIV
jgi:hypothetical protein